MADTHTQTVNDQLLKVAEQTGNVEVAMKEATEEFDAVLKAATEEFEKGSSEVNPQGTQMNTAPTL